MRRLSVSGAILTLSTTVAAGAQAPPSGAALAAQIQAHYSTVRTLTADFTLSQSSALVRRAAVDEGRVVIEKPGKMRWVLETGSESEVVSDGIELYTYLPKDRLVNVISLRGRQPTALLLLTGRGDLTRDFTAGSPTTSPEGDWHLPLTPRTGEADFTTLTLAVDPASLELRGLIVTNEQGVVQTYRFRNLQENGSVPQGTFEFRIPRGVEVRRG